MAFPVTDEERDELYAKLGYLKMGWERQGVFFATRSEVDTDIITRSIAGDLAIGKPSEQPAPAGWTPAPDVVENKPDEIRGYGAAQTPIPDDDIPF